MKPAKARATDAGLATTARGATKRNIRAVQGHTRSTPSKQSVRPAMRGPTSPRQHKLGASLARQGTSARRRCSGNAEKERTSLLEDRLSATSALRDISSPRRGSLGASNAPGGSTRLQKVQGNAKLAAIMICISPGRARSSAFIAPRESTRSTTRTARCVQKERTRHTLSKNAEHVRLVDTSLIKDRKSATSALRAVTKT